MGHHAALRLRSFGYRGIYAYSVTCCAFNKHPRFANGEVVEEVRLQLLETAVARRFAVPAYCFMPDHVHVLAAGLTDSSDLRQFVNLWKQRAGFAYRRALAEPLWQAGFYEHVLRRDEDHVDVVRYIVNNPVRARLVARPDDYPFWGSSVWSRQEILEFISGTGSRGG
jgi:putative transposase